MLRNFTSWLHRERRSVSVSVAELGEGLGKTKMVVVRWHRGVFPTLEELRGLSIFFASQYRVSYRLSGSELQLLARVIYGEAIQKIILDNTIGEINASI